MHLGPPVRVGPAVALVEPEHRGEGSDAEPRDIAAEKEVLFDLDQDAAGAPERQPERAGDAGPVQERMNDDRVVGVRGTCEPVGDEVRELLGLRAAGIGRNAARGKADLAQFADRPPVGGTEAGRPRLAVRPASRGAAFAQPEPGERRRLRRQASRNMVVRHEKVARIVEDLAREAVLEHVHPHGLGRIAADMHQGDGKGAVGTDCLGRVESDPAVGVIVDLVDDLRIGPGRCAIGLRRPPARLADQPCETEGLRLTQPHPGHCLRFPGRRGGHRSAGEDRTGGEAGGEKRAAGESHRRPGHGGGGCSGGSFARPVTRPAGRALAGPA